MTPSRGQAARLQAADELSSFLSALRLGRSVRIGADAFVPLLVDLDGRGTSPNGPPEPTAELLEEAILERRTVLREVGEAGDVNRIVVRHDGQRLLLLIDGEQILGAKQNRVLNASFLVPPGREVDLPVSCVERGRWQYASDTFTASHTTLTGTARSRKVSRVTHSVMSGHGYDAAQREVWRDVDEYIERSQVVSRTSALQDAMSSRLPVVERAMGALRPLAGQVGIGLVREGALVLLDAFGSADLYARAHRKVLRGMLADATGEGRAPAGARRAVARALEAIAGARAERVTAPGVGETLHARAGGHVASAVVHEGVVYHAVLAAA